jgi:hypothetical protein
MVKKQRAIENFNLPICLEAFPNTAVSQLRNMPDFNMLALFLTPNYINYIIRSLETCIPVKAG